MHLKPFRILNESFKSDNNSKDKRFFISLSFVRLVKQLCKRIKTDTKILERIRKTRAINCI